MCDQYVVSNIRAPTTLNGYLLISLVFATDTGTPGGVHDGNFFPFRAP